MSFAEIEEVLSVNAVQFHRQYLPFADVQAFTCRAPKAWVVVKTLRGVLGIGLPASECKDLCSTLRESAERARVDTAKLAI